MNYSGNSNWSKTSPNNDNSLPIKKADLENNNNNNNTSYVLLKAYKWKPTNNIATANNNLMNLPSSVITSTTKPKINNLPPPVTSQLMILACSLPSSIDSDSSEPLNALRKELEIDSNCGLT